MPARTQVHMFQFLIGRLFVVPASGYTLLATPFQFLIGRLFVKKYYVIQGNEHLFQFLIGRLFVHVDLRGLQQVYQCFNSL